MIRIDNAGHWFGRITGCFENLSFVLVPSEVTAILGPNGVGKTTLLRAVCGTLSLREGAVNARRPDGLRAAGAAADHAYSAIDMVLLGRSRFLGRFNSPGRKDKARAL